MGTLRGPSSVRRRRRPILIRLGAAALGVAALLFALPSSPAAPARARGAVVALEIDGAIGPATSEYLRHGLRVARDRGAPMVVLRMDTPGGLESSTHEIVQDILASPVPVATYVAPAGARAASAGTYILYASHLAAMAPGTHLGAATPVQIGGGATPLPGPSGPDKSTDKTGSAEKAQKPEKPAGDAMTAKEINDAAAWIRALAALQGRNAVWGEKAVRRAETLTADEALKLRVIEVVARDVPDLLTQADGRTVRVAGRPVVLHVAGRAVQPLRPDWRSHVLSVITDPNIAYLLLLVGMYGLIFEVLTPGTLAPGVIGAIALMLGLFALNLLPVNYAGLGLLLLGVALLVAEVHAPHGVLGFGGTIALALGSLLLFRGPGPDFRISPWVVLVGVGLSLAFFTLTLGAALRTRRAPVTTGSAALIGARARVVSWSGEEGLVRLQGEQWRAVSRRPLEPGAGVRVIGRDGLTLKLEPDDPPRAGDVR